MLIQPELQFCVVRRKNLAWEASKRRVGCTLNFNLDCPDDRLFALSHSFVYSQSNPASVETCSFCANGQAGEVEGTPGRD